MGTEKKLQMVSTEGLAEGTNPQVNASRKLNPVTFLRRFMKLD
jgi:hypothetical protein